MTDERFQREQDAVIAAVAGIEGWLRPEDERKLYELARAATGPILEIGAYRGRSSVLMARALRDAGNPALLLSVDVDPTALEAAAAAAAEHGVADRVVYVRGSVVALLRAMPALRPGLVFVDGDHSLAGASADLAALEPHVPDGGLLLLHDYEDARNADPAETEYGVVEAVERSWVSSGCELEGVYGCCGLFRRVRGGPAAASAPILDLVAHDGARLQFRQRVRWPLGRAVRRLRGSGS